MDDGPPKRRRLDDDDDAEGEGEGPVRFHVTVGGGDRGDRRSDRSEGSAPRGRDDDEDDDDRRDGRRDGRAGDDDRRDRRRRSEERGPSRAPPGPPRQHRGPYSIRSFPVDPEDDDRGIVFHLGWNRRAGEWLNPVDSRKLRVCASSLAGGHLADTVDRGALFESEDLPFSWVLFDFQECAVRPSRYTLAHRGEGDAACPRSWQLEGSNDNRQWQVLSRHNNDGTLESDRATGGWELKTSTFFRYLRLVLDPQGNSRGGSALSFNGFDVYGDLQVPSKSAPAVAPPAPTGFPALGGPLPDSPGASPAMALAPSALPTMPGLQAAMLGDLSGALPMLMPQLLLGPAAPFVPVKVTQPLEPLRGRLLQCSVGRDESLVLRERLASPECSVHEKQLLLEELLLNLPAVLNDRYGTYVVQALVEASVPLQRKRIALILRSQMLLLVTGVFSCFALMRVVDFLGQDDVFLLAQELTLHLAELSTQKVPSLLVGKLFEALGPAAAAFMLQAMRGTFQAIASTPHGLRVIHKILLVFKDQAQAILPLAEELLPHTMVLVQSPFGKDVVAALLRFGVPAHRKAIVAVLLMEWAELMQHPVACFCCKAAWDNADRTDKENIVRSMLGDPTGALAVELIHNPNSAGVVERVLGTDNPLLRQALLDYYGPHASVIAGLPDRKKLHGLLEGRTALPAPPDAATAARALSRQQRKFGNDLLKRPLP